MSNCMGCCRADFLVPADNYYRTRDFIVAQSVRVMSSSESGTFTISTDTYFARTAFRDREYELIFGQRRNIDGKRLPTSTYTRRYIA